jgi:hypothetical protein
MSQAMNNDVRKESALSGTAWDKYSRHIHEVEQKRANNRLDQNSWPYI